MSDLSALLPGDRDYDYNDAGYRTRSTPDISMNINNTKARRIHSPRHDNALGLMYPISSEAIDIATDHESSKINHGSIRGAASSWPIIEDIPLYRRSLPTRFKRSSIVNSSNSKKVLILRDDGVMESKQHDDFHIFNEVDVMSKLNELTLRTFQSNNDLV